MSASVELRGVSKRFGAINAVDDVSLSVQAGEFVTLLGPSGCGKTTLLRLIAGFETPDRGAVSLGGLEITSWPPYRRDVNQVFQSYALFPHLSVRENIAFGLRMQQLPATEIATRVAESVALVSLEGCEDRRPHELSGGQRQRVALARALAPRPAVLLLDEPLSALDARLRQAMQLELKRLQRQIGTTFILVTHDQEEALAMSDRVALLHQGRIEQFGPPSEIYQRPATRFAAEFMGHVNLLPAELIASEGERARVRLAGDLELVLPSEASPLTKGPMDQRTKGLSDNLTCSQRLRAFKGFSGSESLANKSGSVISIRPESIRLSRQPLGGENVFLARIDEIAFRGASNGFVITTANGTRLTCSRPGDEGEMTAARVGEWIWASVRAEDLLVLSA